MGGGWNITAIECIGHGDYEVRIFYPKMEGNLRMMLDLLQSPLNDMGIRRWVPGPISQSIQGYFLTWYLLTHHAPLHPCIPYIARLITCILEALILFHQGDRETDNPPVAVRDIKRGYTWDGVWFGLLT